MMKIDRCAVIAACRTAAKKAAASMRTENLLALSTRHTLAPGSKIDMERCPKRASKSAPCSGDCAFTGSTASPRWLAFDSARTLDSCMQFQLAGGQRYVKRRRRGCMMSGLKGK